MLARIMNFLNNLSIARKLVLSLSLFLAPILYLIFAIWNDKQELITFAQSEIAGAHYIDVLRDIEADLVQADAAAFAQDGAKVADVEARFGQSFGTGEAAASLAAAFRAPTPSDAASLLASVQGLIGKVADGSNLTLDTDLDSYYLMDATTGKVPDLIARLANLASAARNLAHEAQPSVEAQSNLLVIEGGVGPVMDGLGASLGSAFTATKEASIERALAAPLASTQKAVADDVKSAHQIAFRQRTSAQDELAPTIASLSGLGQSGSSELVRLLEARIGRFHHALTVEFSITFALFAAGVAFTLLALQFGLVRPIGALTTVMRRLAAGDLAFDMPVARRRDEVGAMAGALQVFRDEAQHSRDLQRERTEAEARRANEDEQVRLAAEQAASAEAARLVVSSIGLGLERLAGCDLLFSLNGSLPATYEKLRIDYNNAVATLRGALAKVADDVTAVHGSAAEISSAATDLSQRTEQQAASLEEATSALEQITTTVRKTVGNSGQMRVAVGAAQKEAKQSEIVVFASHRRHERDPSILEPDRTHHRCDRRNRVSDQPPGVECGCRGRSGRRRGSRFCRRGFRGAGVGSTFGGSRQGDQGPDLDVILAGGGWSRSRRRHGSSPETDRYPDRIGEPPGRRNGGCGPGSSHPPWRDQHGNA